jgi:hypothetical protein
MSDIIYNLVDMKLVVGTGASEGYLPRWIWDLGDYTDSYSLMFLWL